MKHFIDRYKNHTVHKELDEFVGAIARAALRKELKEQAVRDGYARFLRVVRFARRALRDTDPSLVTPQAVDQIQKQVAALATQHQTFIEDRNWEALNATADALLNQLYRLPQLSGHRGISEMADTVADFKWDADKVLDDLRGRADQAIERHENMVKKVDEAEARLSQHDQKIEAQKSRLDTLINDESARFTQSELDRSNTFAESEKKRQGVTETYVAERTKEFKERIAAWDTEFAELTEEQRSDASTVLAGLKESLEEAKRLVGIIGNTGMAGHYQQVANAERKTANWLRAGAIVSLVLMAAVVVWVVHEVQATDFNWQIALFRLGVAVTLLAPAIYFATESTKHRRMETRNRQIELELASISPYLSSLPDEKMQQVIEKLADQYFGRGIGESEEEPSSRLKNLRGKDLIKLLQEVKSIVSLPK